VKFIKNLFKSNPVKKVCDDKIFNSISIEVLKRIEGGFSDDNKLNIFNCIEYMCFLTYYKKIDYELVKVCWGSLIKESYKTLTKEDRKSKLVYPHIKLMYKEFKK